MGERKSFFQRISDEALLAKTRSDWREWFQVLGKWDMRKKAHTLTAKHLCQECGLSPWWAQAATICCVWERELGKDVHRDYQHLEEPLCWVGDFEELA